jgi:hypothetical protein
LRRRIERQGAKAAKENAKCGRITEGTEALRSREPVGNEIQAAKEMSPPMKAFSLELSAFVSL